MAGSGPVVDPVGVASLGRPTSRVVGEADAAANALTKFVQGLRPAPPDGELAGTLPAGLVPQVSGRSVASYVS